MNKISLCIIVGNVEEYIERCLRSFAPIADEVCMVRAIGNQEHDGTIEIAQRICSDLGITIIIGEHINAPEHLAWPHVDSFAAARQMSFDMATNDYCFWCDSDDVLKCGAERIRKHANDGAFAAYLFPYEILGKGVTVPRERLVRKDAGRWQYPVHECFKFHVEPVVGAQDDGVTVLHLPHVAKNGSNERNLRILESIPPGEMTPGLRYHLFGEWLGSGQQQKAIELGVELLTEKDALGKDERYDLCMSMVLQTEDLPQRKTLLHSAHMIDPTRREALGILACTAMDGGEYPEALALARQMIATPEPAKPCWNSRTAFYGYIGADICQQALRVNGQNEDAEKLRMATLKANGGPRISLVHATRGRPVQATRCKKRWLDLAEKPEAIEHVFVFDHDDKESFPLRRMHHIEIGAGGGCVRAWNIGALNTSSDIIVQLSDDWTPPPLWDKLILERMGDVKKASVLAVSDGARTDGLLCMAIATREYIAQDWFLFHPLFTGVYSDNWFTKCAYERGQVIDARDLVFTHKHPAFGSAEMDATYAAQNAPERYAQGQSVYTWLETGKDWSSCPGFFNYWWFYDSIVANLKDGDEVAEVGCWLGRSCIYFAQACQRAGKRVKIYAVDTFSGETNQKEHEATVREAGGNLRAKFEENLSRCGVADMVEIIQGDSAASASYLKDGSLAFVFIDAAHDCESVKRDIQAWQPKLKAGAVFAGHDAGWHEVNKAVRELLPQAKFMGDVWAI